MGLISQSVNVDLESIGYYNLGTHIGVNEKPREHQFCCCKIFNLVDIGLRPDFVLIFLSKCIWKIKYLQFPWFQNSYKVYLPALRIIEL